MRHSTVYLILRLAQPAALCHLRCTKGCGFVLVFEVQDGESIRGGQQPLGGPSDACTRPEWGCATSFGSALEMGKSGLMVVWLSPEVIEDGGDLRAAKRLSGSVQRRLRWGKYRVRAVGLRLARCAV